MNNIIILISLEKLTSNNFKSGLVWNLKSADWVKYIFFSFYEWLGSLRAIAYHLFLSVCTCTVFRV